MRWIDELSADQLPVMVGVEVPVDQQRGLVERPVIFGPHRCREDVETGVDGFVGDGEQLMDGVAHRNRRTSDPSSRNSPARASRRSAISVISSLSGGNTSGFRVRTAGKERSVIGAVVGHDASSFGGRHTLRIRIRAQRRRQLVVLEVVPLAGGGLAFYGLLVGVLREQQTTQAVDGGIVDRRQGPPQLGLDLNLIRCLGLHRLGSCRRRLDVGLGFDRARGSPTVRPSRRRSGGV